jgi:DNA-binding response OmpR family regulator
MTKRILLVDDDPLVLRSLDKLLIMNGYDVECVADYSNAMRAIGKSNFDLIISDIRIPGRDGMQIVKEIQSALKAYGKKELPIIFITGYAGEELRLNASFLGETLYKPVDIEELLVTVREYL